MSELFTALRIFQKTQLQKQPDGIRSQLQVVASTVSASDFAALKGSGAPRLQHEPQPQAAAGQPLDDVAAAGESEDEDETLAMSAKEFAALEARVARVVEVVRQERQSLTAAEQRTAQAEAQLSEQAPQIEELKRQLNALRGERQHAQKRLLDLLAELESLEF
jgi:ABC-type transporter Mla subunit MlaD